MPLPEHSERATATYPAPEREKYFTGPDYAAACRRVFENRLKFDGLCIKPGIGITKKKG